MASSAFLWMLVSSTGSASVSCIIGQSSTN